MEQIEEWEKRLFTFFQKNKIGLSEVVKIDGRTSKSKVDKSLAKYGDQKAEEMGIIPKNHMKNGRKRLFNLRDVAEWIVYTK